MLIRSIRRILAPRDLPQIPLQVYESLCQFSGSYPENLLLHLSSLLGQPQMRHRSPYAQHWMAYERYRTTASICDITATWLWRCLDKLHPTVIVEFGTGYSTLVIAAYVHLRTQTAGEKLILISAESDKHWYDAQYEILRKSGLLNSVQLIHAPLEAQSLFGKEVICYSQIQESISNLASSAKADFIFVDGPTGTQYGGPGRHGSLLQAISLTRDGGTILLHDALRAEEYKAIRYYQTMQSLGFTCHGIVPVWYGLAICEKVNKPSL